MGNGEAIRANQVAMIDRLDRVITLMNELCGYENSALHILEEVHKKKSAPPNAMPLDGPENSAQQLYGKMPKSCHGCPITSACVIAVPFGAACQTIWRELFRHFAGEQGVI